MPITYETIASTTLTSAQSTIQFSSITGTYTDLRVVFYGKSVNSAVSPYMRFNSVSTLVYSICYLYGNGTTYGSAIQSGQSLLKLGETSSTSTSFPIFCTVDIFSYADTTIKKSVLYVCNNDKNGSGVIENGVGTWDSANAITTITIGFTSGNIDSGATATLYGIKKA